MAVNIKLKRSAVPGQAPDTSQLELGELALNTHDGKAFFKKDDGTQSIVELASYTSGSSVASASYANYADNAGTANTASYVNNAISSSFATTASYVTLAQTASYVLNALSASYALTASYTPGSDTAISASYASTASSADDFLVRGTLTAQTIIAQYITSSTSFITGSTKFGSDLTNTHQFTGSLSVSGSLSVDGVDYASLSASFDTRILNNSSSIGLLSSSFLSVSASNSIRISDLEQFSASLDATYATDAQLNYSASVLSSSIAILSSSYTAFSSSFSTGSFTGSFNGGFTGSFSGSLNNFQGTARHIPFFSSSQVLNDSSLYQVGDSSVAINQNAVTTAAPEALYVWQPSTSSFNVISGKGNLDNYLQLNIHNTNQGPTASSDIVATANNGNEFANYINMGINSENFSGFLGGPNDAYIYATGSEFHIGNITPGKHLGFFVGGDDVDAGNKFALYPTNEHQMTGSLDVSGSVQAFDFTGSLLGDVTGSLYGTASWASNSITASYASVATSASFTATASSADDFLVRGTLTAQTINVQTITSSVEFVTGSTHFGSIISNTHEFTGSVSVSGSLAVNESNVILTNQTSSMSVATASYVANAQTASYVENAQTASYVLNAVSASYAATASYANVATSASYAFSATSSSFASSGLGIFSGSFSGSFSGNGAGLTNIPASGVVGLNLSQITSGSVTASVDPSGFKVNSNATISGSTQITGSLGVTGSVSITGTGSVFSANIDTISFTGSFAQSGSVIVVGGVTATSFTGSLLGTASYASQANSASYAVTASYANVATSASYAFNATTSSYALFATSASYAGGSTSASYALNASQADNATSASFAATASSADNFLVRGTLTAQTIVAQYITSSVEFVTGSTHFGSIIDNTHQFTGSVTVSGSLAVNDSNVILTNQTSSMSVATASYVTLAQTASYVTLAQTASYVENAQTASFVQNAQTASYVANAQSASYVLNAVSASYASNADLLDGKDSSTFATTGSNIFIGNQTVTGSLFTSGSNNLVGSTTLTGSLLVTGSTTQIGNNTLTGNTTLSGSIIISGSQGVATASVQIYGDIRQTGYHRFDPVSTNIDTSISASYIYVSGSTQDLYFSQNGSGYSNVTRLRWLEGNLYTGLLHGGVITAATGSTTYNVSSGSGIIVNLNASLSDDPYPTIQYLNWGNLSASISPLTASYQQAFVSIDSTGNIYQQGTPYAAGQFDTEINIGVVLFQNGSTINGVKTQPSVAYGFEQSQNIFNRAFGPLKLSGYTLAPSGSSTRSLIVGSGTAYAPGSNYTVDPNNPSYTTDSGTSVSKIYRYYQSGSSWVYLTNAGAGYTTIDPEQYSNNGTLSGVANNSWSIQRVFYFPNSVAKAIVVYYGNTVYSTEAEAIANINIESFVEAPNTAANAIYLGSIVIKGDGVFTTATDFTVVPGGLFRSVGGSGGGGSVITQTLSGLSDVLIAGPTSGQALVYDTTAAKWENKSFISASISGNAATAISASYAATASFVTLAQTASYVENAQTASYVTLAQTASYVLNAVSSSFASTASYVTLAQTASFVQTCTNCIYVLNAVSSSFASTASFVQNQTASYVLKQMTLQ
jgi:hypothetical protein